MKHNELQQNDIVIFKKYCDITKQEEYQDGSVINVYDDKKEVMICYLEGYKSRTDTIPYNKVIAKYDKDGMYMTFGVYSGNSILLEQ